MPGSPVQGPIELAQVGQVVRYARTVQQLKGRLSESEKKKLSRSSPVRIASLTCTSSTVVQDDDGEWHLHSDRGPFAEWVEVAVWYHQSPTTPKKDYRQASES